MFYAAFETAIKLQTEILAEVTWIIYFEIQKFKQIELAPPVSVPSKAMPPKQMDMCCLDKSTWMLMLEEELTELTGKFRLFLLPIGEMNIFPFVCVFTYWDYKYISCIK